MKTIDEVICMYNERIRMLKKYAEECEEYSRRKIDRFLKLDVFHIREKENYLKEAEEYEQIIEWLEELKELRERL